MRDSRTCGPEEVEEEENAGRCSEAPEVREVDAAARGRADEHIERARRHLVAADVEPRERREAQSRD